MRYQDSWFELVQPPIPAVGQPLRYRIPGETFAAVSHAAITLTTSAVVADRYVGLEYLSGDNGVTYVAVASVAQAASTTRKYCFALNVGNLASVASGHQSLSVPDSLLPPGFILSFNAFGLDVGDQFSIPFLYLLRVPSGKSADADGSRPYSDR